MSNAREPVSERFMHTDQQNALPSDDVEIVPLPDTTTAPLHWLEQRRYRRALLTVGLLCLLALALVNALPWITSSNLTALLRGSTPATPTPIRAHAWQGYDVYLTLSHGVLYASTLNHAVYALRCSDGQLLWRFQENGAGSSTTSAPTVINGVVYVYTIDYHSQGQESAGFVYALRATDGQQLWQYAVQDLLAVSVQGTHVYLSTTSVLSALDARTGQPLWQQPITVAGSPLEFHGILYVGAYTHTRSQLPKGQLYALRTSDGHPLWSRTLGNMVVMSVARLQQGRLYVSGLLPLYNAEGSSAPSKVLLYAVQASDGAPRWQQEFVGSGVTDLLFAGHTLYMGINRESSWPGNSEPAWQLTVYALHTDDGHWLWQHSYPQYQVSQLSLQEGRLYLMLMAGTPGQPELLVALRAGDGQLLWQHSNQQTTNVILLAGNHLYLSEQEGAVLALQSENGSSVWSYPIDGAVQTPLLLDDTTLYLGGSNGVVYALDAQQGTLRWYYQTEVFRFT
jgi:outer membrane protein assembly factor BamB